MILRSSITPITHIILMILTGVLYDAGGYGMLGFGHNPPQVMHEMAAPQVILDTKPDMPTSPANSTIPKTYYAC
jgi:hypothetical protein